MIGVFLLILCFPVLAGRRRLHQWRKWPSCQGIIAPWYYYPVRNLGRKVTPLLTTSSRTCCWRWPDTRRTTRHGGTPPVAWISAALLARSRSACQTWRQVTAGSASGASASGQGATSKGTMHGSLLTVPCSLRYSTARFYDLNVFSFAVLLSMHQTFYSTKDLCVCFFLKYGFSCFMSGDMSKVLIIALVLPLLAAIFGFMLCFRSKVS